MRKKDYPLEKTDQSGECRVDTYPAKESSRYLVPSYGKSYGPRVDWKREGYRTEFRGKYVNQEIFIGPNNKSNWFQLGDNIINIFKLQQQLREGGIIYRGYDTGIWHRKHREIIETVLNDFKKALKQIINIKEGTP